ncbi:MAG: N-acetylneuraminate synthase family protein [Proteobacteria bacterium]|nr:N-acetylneuraminate synthase family protein [Pseudomonadota bacterium]
MVNEIMEQKTDMKQNLIYIGNHLIGDGKTFIVAEIASNHNQDINLALELIDAALQCGANAVKFQSINIDELYYKPDKSTKELHKQIDISEKWLIKLKEYSDKKNIVFFASPTYLKAVDILESIQTELYKLASAQIGTFPQIIERVAKTGKPVLLSTGLVSYSDLEKVVKIFKNNGNERFVILHCNSIYPTPYNKVNLQLMHIYRMMFNQPVGFSDHTLGIYVPIAAVSLGASVIEKHFTLDRKLKTPDSDISLNQKEFTEMVKAIRSVEQSLISKSRINIDDDEKKFKEKIIYRIILKYPKEKGDPFKDGDFEFKRYPRGIDCRDSDFIVSHLKPKKYLQQGTFLKWSDLEGQ